MCSVAKDSDVAADVPDLVSKDGLEVGVFEMRGDAFGPDQRRAGDTEDSWFEEVRESRNAIGLRSPPTCSRRRKAFTSRPWCSGTEDFIAEEIRRQRSIQQNEHRGIHTTAPSPTRESMETRRVPMQAVGGFALWPE